jgi:hypothetical protein
LLEQAAENNPQMKDQVRMHFAQFMEQLFGVQTMAQGRFGRGFGFGGVSDDDTKKNESGTYDLHTLKDEETIAKLASGSSGSNCPMSSISSRFISRWRPTAKGCGRKRPDAARAGL